jgi:two-component system chemotaxis sensor kinase CheA
MSIRHRITLLIILSVIAIFTIGGYSIYQARLNAAEVKKVTEGVVPSALETADLVSQVKEVQLVTMGLVSEPDASLAAQAREKLVGGKAKLKEGIDFQLSHAADKVQQGLVQQAKENLVDYFAAIDETVNFKMAGQTDLASASYYSNVVVLQRELQQIVDTLRIEKSREKDGAISALNANLSKTATAVAGLSVVIMVGLGLFGFILYRQIITPISQMQETTSEIASTQDFTRRVPVHRMDEIGRSIVAFNMMITKIEENSALLKQKTNDIQTMLQNMPQGILTIADGNVIHPEYSAYLEKIFDTANIAGQNFMSFVFSNTSLGADALSQIEAAVGACIGEDAMNFDFNSHLLVAEIEKTMPDGQMKILDLSWSPITDDAGTVVRLMMCVRDVTELRSLAAEANKQKRELEIIGEILSVTQEKFHEFTTSSLRFVDENELLIRENPEQDTEALTTMFRNMHTIKGNARTYGLNHLTNIVHEVEHSYVELSKPHPDFAWDQATMMSALLGVKDMLKYYAKINEVSLGRKGPGRRAGVEHFLMVDKQQIIETIDRLEKATSGNLNELRAAHDAVHKTLRLLGTERIVETLEGVFDSLPALARELGKLPPVVDIQDNGYVIHHQASGLLKNVFMHLLRNAMDHGLESPEERATRNKPLAGTISLQMAVRDGMLQIVLNDDGRGLALAHIRKMAIERELIKAEDQLDDEAIANLIFRAGFSTAQKVTEISGRGVGMDAVKDYIGRENGMIKIRFTDTNVGADFRQFEMIVCLPKVLSENVEGFNFRSQDELEDALVEFKSEETVSFKQA